MINTKRLIDNFVTIAKIYSPTGSEDTLRYFLVSLLGDLVDIAQVDKYGNIYCRVNGTGDSVFFAAHMDTVEPCKNVKPIVSNDKITSDGTTILGADNKVTIAGLIEMLAVIKDQKEPHRTIEIMFTRSEEVGNHGAINFDYSLLTSKIGYCFDSILPIGTIITASPYYEAVDITLEGEQIHASIATEDQNLIKIASELIGNMKLGRVDDETIMNIGILQTGYARNTVPGEVIMKGEIRSYRYENIIREKTKIDQLLSNLSKKFGTKFKTLYDKENDGYVHDSKAARKLIEQNKLVLKSIDVIPQEVESWAVSDANIFNTKGLICINLGDGVERAHSKQECIRISEMDSMVRQMLALVSN